MKEPRVLPLSLRATSGVCNVTRVARIHFLDVIHIEAVVGVSALGVRCHRMAANTTAHQAAQHVLALTPQGCAARKAGCSWPGKGHFLIIPSFSMSS